MFIEQLTYTACERGRGFDPKRSGYQVRACSAGITGDLRELLASVCTHYGDTVYRFAPAAALDAETEWRHKTAILENIPEEVLAEFPIVWSYGRLNDCVFGLTVVRYVGLTYAPEFRTGNFFAHALVFNPEELRTHGFNPLNLADSKLILKRDPGGSSDLAVLDDLGAAGGEVDTGPLAELAVGDTLAALVTALSSATAAARPVLVCLNRWQEAVPMVRALLSLLPPTARARTTFCTYESDRRWVPTPADRKLRGTKAAPHDLVVLCPTEDRPLDLRPDEYNSGFAVFNFVEDRLGRLDDPTAFGRLAARCVKLNDMARLQRHHEITERLGAGMNSPNWDKVATWTELTAEATGQEVAIALEAIASMATDSDRVGYVLDELLLREVRRLSQRDDAAGLSQLAGGTTRLASRRGADGQLDAEILVLARAALAEGRGAVLSALLECSARKGRNSLVEVFRGLPADIPVVSTEEAEQVTWRLAEGAAALEDDEPAVESAVLMAFRLARQAQCAPAVWKRIGLSVALPRLTDPWNPEKRRFAERLLADSPPRESPEAHLALGQALVVGLASGGDDTTERWSGLAEACVHHPDSDKATRNLARLVERQVTDRERVLTFARLAEAAYATGPGVAFLAAYRQAVQALQALPGEPAKHKIEREGKKTKKAKRASKPPEDLRCKLADAGLVRVLWADFADQVIPWNERNRQRFESWWAAVLKRRRELRDTICREVGSRLGGPKDGSDMLELARELIPRSLAEGDSGPGLAALVEGLAAAVPFDASSKHWVALIDGLPEPLRKLPPALQDRIDVLRFVVVTAQAASALEWSITQFDCHHAAWKKVAWLSPADKDRAFGWLVEGPLNSGITTTCDVEAVIALLEAAGETSAEKIGEVVANVTRARDLLTRVLVAAVFARTGLQGAATPTRFGRILRVIVEPWDTHTRRLLEDHLYGGFGMQQRIVRRRLKDLCQEAGLALSPSSVDKLEAPAGPGGGHHGGGIGFLKRLFYGGSQGRDKGAPK